MQFKESNKASFRLIYASMMDNHFRLAFAQKTPYMAKMLTGNCAN